MHFGYVPLQVSTEGTLPMVQKVHTEWATLMSSTAQQVLSEKFYERSVLIRASLRIPPRPRTLRDHKKAIEWSDGKVPLRVRSNQTGEGGTEEGKLFVHFAPAWRMCRAIRRMLRGVGYNFITVKLSQARAIVQNMLDSAIKPGLPPQAESRNLSKSPAMVSRHS